MTVADLIKEAESLPVPERGHLLDSLLRGLPLRLAPVSDEEVARRRREIDSGDVSDISFEELTAGLDLPR